MADARRFVRDNLVFIAAFALPGLVAALFIVATTIPTLTVPLPQHDLLFRIERYQSPPPEVTVEFVVRDGRLEAVVAPVPKPVNPAMGVPYVPRWVLLMFDHTSNEVREIPLDLPHSVPDGETRTVVIDQFADRRIVAGSTAPDGYTVSSLNTGSGGGIVGELFGMNRSYRRRIAVARNGRTLQVDLPVPYRDSYNAIIPIGWIADESPQR
jgi:hypothetical protein